MQINTTASEIARKQRLKEAVWHIQGHAWRGLRAKYRVRIIESELALLADAIGVPMLDAGEAGAEAVRRFGKTLEKLADA